MKGAKMANPTVRADEPHFSVRCYQAFRLRVRARVYENTDLMVCCELPSGSPCHFINTGQSYQLCQRRSQLSPSEITIDFYPQIACNNPGQTYGLLMQIVATNDQGEQGSTTVTLDISC